MEPRAYEITSGSGRKIPLPEINDKLRAFSDSPDELMKALDK